MKTKLLVATLLAGSTMFAETHFSIGIGVGGHGYAAPAVAAYRPHYPGPGYTWVEGYWDHAGPRRFWHDGFWARQSYGRSYAVAPHYEGYRDERYSNSYNGNGYNASRDNWTSPGGTNYNGNNNAGNRGAGNRNGNSPNGNFSGGTIGNRFDNPNGRR
jgi:hypothetical protein